MDTKKVFCDDCQTEVEESKTVLFGNDTICNECAQEDLDVPMDFEFLSIEQEEQKPIH